MIQALDPVCLGQGLVYIVRLSAVQLRVGEREVNQSNIWKAKNLPSVIAPYHCSEIFSPFSEKPYLLGFGEG